MRVSEIARRGAYYGVLAATRRGAIIRIGQFIRSHYFAPKTHIEQIVRNRIAKLLRHCLYNVPYYRNLFAQKGLSEKQIQADPIAALSSLPLLTKSHIRQHFQQIQSVDLPKRRWYYNTSGGSTGEPVRFVQDHDYFCWSMAQKYVFETIARQPIGRSRIVVWGSERDILGEGTTRWTKIGRWLRSDWVINAFRITAADVDLFLRLNKMGVQNVIGYTSSLEEIAQHLLRRDTKACFDSIICTAGTLYPEARRKIEQLLGGEVFNYYGSREVGAIACECALHQGLHISPFTVFIEIVDESGCPMPSGVPGEIVVTSLINYAFPLIRYKIGDVGIISDTPCSCGCSWPMLREVRGRTTDMFVAQDGSRIDGEFFTHLVYFVDWILKFRFVQESYELVRLEIVPSIGTTNVQEQAVNLQRDLEPKIQAVLGSQAHLELVIVNEITPTASGKHRYTVSRVLEGTR
jgi:phenylacetate-CoA ligase